MSMIGYEQPLRQPYPGLPEMLKKQLGYQRHRDEWHRAMMYGTHTREDNMSIRRDGWRDHRGYVNVGSPHSIGENTPIRTVDWPEGAPPQEDVPYAGDLVTWSGWGVYTITTGIPIHEEEEGHWGIHVTKDGGHQQFAWLQYIRPYVPPVLEPKPEIVEPHFHAGQPVTLLSFGYDWGGRIFLVVDGIIRNGRVKVVPIDGVEDDTWDPMLAIIHPVEFQRTYTEDEIRGAFEGKTHRNFGILLQGLREGS